MRTATAINEYWKTFSFIGLVIALIFFSFSVTPSLLPRPYYVQGILSAFAIAIGYAVGVTGVWTYQVLELPNPGPRVQHTAKITSAIAVAVLYMFFIWQMAFWQNSIRERMGLAAIETAYPYRTAIIAIIGAAILIAVSRLVIRLGAYIKSWLDRILPRRISIFLTVVIVGILMFILGNDIVARKLLEGADRFFLQADELIDDELAQPTAALVTGSADSLVDWQSIGRQGKNFILHGPSQQAIQDFLGRDAQQPIRVYVGMRSADTPQERARLALEELKRVGGFERSVLVIATPTGTGWLDPGAVDTVEYLHAGDIATVATQYSYLPSWITILVDPRRSIDSADALFEAIYGHWKTLPKKDRPKLYLHGLSLGSLGSESSADLYSTFEDPIQGGVFSGPPFPSRQWNEIVAHRNPNSPPWLPTYRDERMVRFMSQVYPVRTEKAWGPIRNVYIQHASDPMVFFSPSLLYEKPAWLNEPRGPDVSPHLTWFPLVTFLQVAFDLPVSTSVPIGFGHNYAPDNYIDAWVAVTQPPSWTSEQTSRLKSLFKPSP